MASPFSGLAEYSFRLNAYEVGFISAALYMVHVERDTAREIARKLDDQFREEVNRG